MQSGIRPTGTDDFITFRELEKTRILTTSERSTTNRESDNECCVGCEDRRLTWSERQARTGLIGVDSPFFNKPAGVMSTCEAPAQFIIVHDVERTIEEAARLRRAYR